MKDSLARSKVKRGMEDRWLTIAMAPMARLKAPGGGNDAEEEEEDGEWVAEVANMDADVDADVDGTSAGGSSSGGTIGRRVDMGSSLCAQLTSWKGTGPMHCAREREIGVTWMLRKGMRFCCC